MIRRERRFRSLVQAASQVVWVAGADGAVRSFLGDVEHVLGPEPDRFTGWNFLAIVHPDDRDAFVAAMQAAVADSAPYRHEVRVQLPDGSYRYFLCHGVPVRDDLGCVVEWVGMASDTHDRKTAELALREKSAMLARTVAELEQFANASAHDLREPLRTVASYVQLIERRLGTAIDPKLREDLRYTVDAVRQMEQLTDDVRVFLGLGRSGPFEPVALDRLIEETGRALAQQGGRVTHDALPVVPGNAAQLRELFMQLLGNALRFRSDAPPQIHVGLRQDGGRPVIFVRDNGIGIEPQHLELIFGLFKRLHRRERYPGSGLGLAICRKIVANHRGHIWAESAGVGQGTTIAFTLNETGSPAA